MAKIYANNYPVTGSTSYASAVTYVDKDGNKSTVQEEIDKLKNTFIPLDNYQEGIASVFFQKSQGATGKVTFPKPFKEIPQVSAYFPSINAGFVVTITQVTNLDFSFSAPVYSSADGYILNMDWKAAIV